MNNITIGMTYRNRKDGNWVRVVGWYGQNSVAYETVYLSFRTITLHGAGVNVRLHKDKSKRIYTLTMTKFSETFREPEPGDAS